MPTPADSFIQVAPDSIGKQLDATLVQTGSGPSIYQQRAELKGDPADVLFQILWTQQRMLAVLRAMLANQNTGNSTPNLEDDYLNID